MAEMLVALYRQLDHHDQQVMALRESGKPADAEGHAMASRSVAAQIQALEDLAVSSRPTVSADAVAQLVLILFRCETLMSSAEDGSNRTEIRSLMEAATHSLSVLAAGTGFDLSLMGQDYLSYFEEKIVRGEVPA
jgi:hypothetical protein